MYISLGMTFYAHMSELLVYFQQCLTLDFSILENSVTIKQLQSLEPVISQNPLHTSQKPCSHSLTELFLWDISYHLQT